ncbi:hypothetical protein BOQ62_15245 [Chryseobacterium sp. CH21]|nr:hypothetical protein BOQ62_15245 [Chryseobacterium sp. CH21]
MAFLLFNGFTFLTIIYKLKKGGLNNRIPVLIQNNQKAAPAVFFISVKYYKKSRKSYKFAAK